MNEQQSNQNTEAVVAALPANKLSPFLQLAQTRGHCELHVALPAAPLRQLCSTKRSVLAALRSAEFAEWQASGGDFLSSVL